MSDKIDLVETTDALKSKVSSNHMNLVASMAVGSALALYATASNERSTGLTVGLTAAAAALNVYTVYDAEELGLFMGDGVVGCGAFALGGFVSTGLVGAVANTLFGKSNETIPSVL